MAIALGSTSYIASALPRVSGAITDIVPVCKLPTYSRRGSPPPSIRRRAERPGSFRIRIALQPASVQHQDRAVSNTRAAVGYQPVGMNPINRLLRARKYRSPRPRSRRNKRRTASFDRPKSPTPSASCPADAAASSRRSASPSASDPCSSSTLDHKHAVRIRRGDEQPQRLLLFCLPGFLSSSSASSSSGVRLLSTMSVGCGPTRTRRHLRAGRHVVFRTPSHRPSWKRKTIFRRDETESDTAAVRSCTAPRPCRSAD